LAEAKEAKDKPMRYMRAASAWLRAVGLAAAIAAPVGAAPLTRNEALHSLEHPQASARRAGVERLAAVGTMADADRLVPRLADDEAQVREAAEAALWQIWSRSGDGAIDALYWRGVQQMQDGRLSAARSTFSEIIRRKPAFAEGWNKRATVLYLLGEYELSLKDCDEVLKRNRNHFGALSGIGQIQAALGRFELARDAFERALQINPNLPGAAQALRQLEQLLEQGRRRTI
jgi:tetratricopeptide (TPR) repeat protein